MNTSINRRTFLGIISSFATATWAGVGLADSKDDSPPPNILLIIADDWGWGDLGCYGHPHLRTPNLDRLATQGRLFTEFYSNSPVCSPSRAAFLTGRFPSELGIHAHFSTPEENKARSIPDYLDPNLPNLANLFRGDGYTTAFFGKWHLGGQEIFGKNPDGSDLVFPSNAPAVERYGFDKARIVSGKGEGWDDILGENFWPNSSKLFVDEAIGFIEKNRSRPFFVTLALLDTHAVLNPTNEQMQPYRQFGPRSPAGDIHRGAMQIYYAAATNADAQIGRLLSSLDRLGIADNTIVIFTSDNGPEDIHVANASHSGVGSTGPLRGRKRSLYEGGIRMPFIVRWTAGGVPAGTVNDTTVMSGADLLPTLASLQKISLPSDLKLNGEDLHAAFFDAGVRRTNPLMWEWRYPNVGSLLDRSPQLAIRDGKWKLLANPDFSEVELYDIKTNPTEVDNVADQNPDIVKALYSQLMTWREKLPPGFVDPEAGRRVYKWPNQSPP